MKKKRQMPPPQRYQVVAREHDEFGRVELTIDPKTKQPVSTDPKAPTEIAMDDFWARRLADRSITVVSVGSAQEQRQRKAKPRNRKSKKG